MTETISKRQLEIIEAAGKILTTSGVSGLTIKNLAKEMNFSESAIYRHFTSREEIILNLLQFLSENIDKRLAEITDSALEPEEKFRKIFSSQFRFFNAHPHFVVAVFSDGLLEESDKINRAILNLMMVKMKHLMPVIMEGQQKKIFTGKISNEDLVHMVMGSFRLQIYKWRITGFQMNLEKEGQRLVDSLLTIIKSKGLQ